ncbi:SulP family inorganic anion transporter [bacterium]|nr:SulP family inorganic anion transporter [bacterium]
MTTKRMSMWRNWRYDLPAALVVFLVALPLCLGIALASGASPLSGLIAGIVGGVVVGILSKSPLSVSGPAAGLTVIVLAAIQSLPSYEAFLLAVCLAGAIQLALGYARAGIIGDFIPSSVIKGMLAAIGIILILKQVPHAFGYDADYEGDHAFFQHDGQNTFSALLEMINHITPGAAIISLISLAFLFTWDNIQPKLNNALRYLPGPLVVVGFGVAANLAFQRYAPGLAIQPEHLVAVPVADSASAFFAQFSTPDFSMIGNPAIWSTAVTLALVASVETLLSIEAIDKLDPFKRITPTNRELKAQGIGNIVSGLIGGLPITSVIVRSSANVSSGGRTRMSTICHGLLLLLCVISIPTLLNQIPLAALAAVLIAVGYKLTKPAIFMQKFAKGWEHFIPFTATILAILMTDLLVGIGVGIVVGMGFVIVQNWRAAIVTVTDGNKYHISCKKDLFFIHKYDLKQTLDRIPEGSSVLLDFSKVNFIDLDNVEIIQDFMTAAPHKDIALTVKNPNKSSTTLSELIHEAA